MRRREFMAFLGSAAAALPLTASAQQSAPPSPVRQDWLDRRKEPALEPELPIVDPHHHLWVRPGWRYMLDDFLADTRTGHNIVATVFVQANSMYRDSGPVEMRSVGETEFVNGMAAICASGYCGKTRVAAGIVGYADLRLGGRAEPVLAALMRAGGDRFRGVRFGTAWDPDPAFINPANLSSWPFFQASTMAPRSSSLCPNSLRSDSNSLSCSLSLPPASSLNCCPMVSK